MNDMPSYTEIRTREDVTDEIREIIESVVDGWYETGRVNWLNLLERCEEYTLDDGSHPDFGTSWTSPAIDYVKSYVRTYRRSE